ncbi:MAG: phosphohydrolase [Bacteroidetes bacterium]|nr:phosphohydrolase [Bacteroidota bacterium]
MERLFEENKIRTFTGKFIDPLDPDPSLINIIDIAHALAKQCRFSGHINQFYSVAEHSMFVSNLMQSDHDKLCGLLHDAAEAYLIDMPRPIKHRLANFCEIEDNLHRVIASVFRIQYPFPDTVKEADNFALRWEWVNMVINDRNTGLDHKFAKRSFLGTYELLATRIGSLTENV